VLYCSRFMPLLQDDGVDGGEVDRLASFFGIYIYILLKHSQLFTYNTHPQERRLDHAF